MNIIRLEQTLSTNLFLKELSEKQTPEEGTLVLAENQTAGRGQSGNEWESEPNKNITCSILFYPSFLDVARNFLLSKAVALGIKETLDAYMDCVSIKWPNDIYFEDKKIAGILIENNIIGKKLSQSIVGIGLNVNQDVFSGKAPNPVSMKQILDVAVDKEILLRELSDKINGRYEQLKSGEYESINEEYRKSLYRSEGFYPYQDKDGQFEAEIVRVADDGLLCLITPDGENRQYYFKEVSQQELRTKS
ncbi:MAG: biotin--[acetyl-CoA-carboxylase] ligase [Dysgonamonadaceae bacterium]|jgi:BirA family biotin operon repressor/biotin-[acetyl-CoA-carboxylase] ligase|nr:biotin--[acetyl-CoA-carboxylase] ligase [Dysgonamonadaceae bacterium]